MSKSLLFIHGGGDGAYEEDKKMALHLQETLGAEYNVIFPKMPDEGNPKYEAWREQISKELISIDGDVTIVGHSLGASLLIKYLSEEQLTTYIAGLFLIAPPYWGAEDWEVEEYALSEEFPTKLSNTRPMYFYHSSEDEWVPFAHLSIYAGKLPHAVIYKLDGRNHQLNNDMTEVARDIKNLIVN
ncbi:alpha/beta fold hydrolase [Paenibacillus sp. L3-i20]|uniref:alpha/beta fold hydrolase n=1 Tax=Paenibacillus sp. L3-i20 TaxID=2905833 RepID=UPI001EDC9C2F|nr:alpha/beta fold hydrolase [Paenibacillus sp. L3-i20]